MLILRGLDWVPLRGLDVATGFAPRPQQLQVQIAPFSRCNLHHFPGALCPDLHHVGANFGANGAWICTFGGLGSMVLMGVGCLKSRGFTCQGSGGRVVFEGVKPPGAIFFPGEVFRLDRCPGIAASSPPNLLAFSALHFRERLR